MMHQPKIIISICMTLACLATSTVAGDIPPQEGTNQTPSDTSPKPADPKLETPDDPTLVKAIEEALVSIKKESPTVHEDALRVWKNYKENSKPANYTYRFWARSLIVWLKDNKKIVFDSEKKVGAVFTILWHKKLISPHAVLVLTVDCWAHLRYLEGSPGWEKKLENRSPEGGAIPSASEKSQQTERAV